MTDDQGQEEDTTNGGSNNKATMVLEEVEKRLIEATERRDLLQAAIKNRHAELEGLLATVPNRPREKLSELNEKIAKLERDRTINSIDLQEERKILWEIKRVEKIKNEVIAFETHDKLIKDKKTQIAELKEAIKPMREEADNLYTELSVAKTAGRVGCSPEELVGSKIDCPTDKLGNVIGKKGANVKKLQEKASVSVNVMKEGDVRIMGAPDSVDAATGDLCKVISAVDETLDVPSELVSYLTAKDITALDGFRERHPDVRLFVLRNSASILMRGTPEDIEKAKIDILDFDLATKEFDLPSAEASHVVGKQGATIENIQATHQVAVNVERKEGDNTSHVTINGPENKIMGAFSEIERLAAEVREATLTIPIDPCVRTLLLQNSGAGIQDIRQKVVSKLDGGAFSMSLSSNAVVLTGQTRSMPVALEIAGKEVKSIESTIVIIDTDPVVIPVIIGKGGERINKLCEGKKVNIEIDKTAKGKVTLCGYEKDQVTEVELALKDLIAGHQVTRINIDALFYKSQSRDIIRFRSSQINALCHFKCDDDRCDIVLRGESDKIEEAEGIVREFLETNFKEEVSVSGEDMRTLLTGGKECKLQEISAEYDIKLHSNRERGIIEARGKRENVQQAVKAIHHYLYGGDGYTIAKVSLTDELLGMVIGKGGKKKAELQSKYENVSIVVNGKEKSITLRGPEDQVEGCRADILQLVATARVTGTIAVSKETHDKLNKAHAARDAIHGIPVQLTISNDAITVRGYNQDVKDALAHLNAAIQGKYESRLALPSAQFQIVKNTCSRNSLHLDRITKTSGASVIVDSSDETIVLRGKQGQVKKAKLELMKFLEFLLSPSFGRLDIPASLVNRVADVPTLAEVSAVSGASVVLDRDIHSLLIFSTDSPKVVYASAQLQSKISDAEKLCFELQLEPTEDWVISSVIGKRGQNINSLRKKTKCHIDVDSKTLKVTVTAEDPESLAKGRETLEAFVDKTRRECAVIEIPERDLPAFIGRGGAGITEFAKTHSGADVQLQKHQAVVRITGEESHVTTAKTALHEWLKHREDSRKQSHSFEVMQIQKSQIRGLLANKGAKVHAVQEEFHCRIDIDREKAMVSIRAANDDMRKGAVAKIRTIVEEGLSTSDSGEVTTSSDENLPAKPARKDGRRRGKKSTSSVDEGVGETKKSPQPPVQDSDFPALIGNSASQASDSTPKESGAWVSAATQAQSESYDKEHEEDQYMAMVADGAAADDEPVSQKGVTAA